MVNEKRYYIRCETRANWSYYGPYTIDEVDAKVSYFNDEDTRVSVWEYFNGNWYWNAWGGWHEERRHLADPEEDKWTVCRLAQRKREFESSEFSRLDQPPREGNVKPVSSNAFFSEVTIDQLNGETYSVRDPELRWYSMTITPETTTYWTWWHFDEATKRQREVYEKGNRFILFTRKNGEWYYFPTENEKGASTWAKETVVPSANTKDCTTSTTKTCTYTRLAVIEHGKNRS